MKTVYKLFHATVLALCSAIMLNSRCFLTQSLRISPLESFIPMKVNARLLWPESIILWPTRKYTETITHA